MKKIICFLLVLSILLPTCSTVFANDEIQLSVDSGITIQDNSRTVSASKSQVTAAQAYDIDFTSIPVPASSSQSTAKDAILALCELQSTQVNGQHAFKDYISETLAEHIPMCSSLSCIQESNNLLYVNYTSIDGKTVSLVYSDTGLHEKNIYDPTTDSLIHQTASDAEVYENFRTAISYEMSDELEDLVHELIAAKKWDTLAAIDGLDISVTDDGIITVEPQLDTPDALQVELSLQSSSQTRSSYEGFTSTAALLADLNSHFPSYTYSMKYGTTVYCSALSQSLSARVYESRNEYTQKRANWQSFSAGTSISIIGVFVGGGPSVASAILAVLGIAISAYDTILQTVTLYNSAVYTYWGERFGYVYDPTKFNDYVRMVVHQSKGEFTGGYTSSGVFDWVHSVVSSAFSHSYADIIDTAGSLYNAEVFAYGYCLHYFPRSYYS